MYSEKCNTQLRRLGINENSIKYNNITMESDRCIVIKESTKLSIVNIATRNVVSLPVTLVDSAIMNPSTNVLGIRHKNNLQIFNLDMKTKIKSIDISDDILYWRWLDSRTISYVTSKSVYHWSMESDLKPQKKFDIVAEERKIQCIGYDASKDGNFLYLQGIARSHDNSIEGIYFTFFPLVHFSNIKKNYLQYNTILGALQLFNVPSKKYQPKMNALGGCFAYLNINGRDATLFCFTRKDGNSTKLFMVEIGNNNANPLKIQKEIRFQQQNDFIIKMIPSEKFGCIYGITQQGWLYIFDLSTGKEIFSRRISNVSLFIAVPRPDIGGIMVCDRNGMVSSIVIDDNKYISYIKDTLNDPQLAVQIATKYGLSGAEEIFKMRFKQLVTQLQFQQAVRLAVNAPGDVLRTPETIQILQTAPNAAGGPPPDLQYYTLLLQKGTLNAIESVGLCQRILNAKPQEGIAKIEKFIQEKKLENSEVLLFFVCSFLRIILTEFSVLFVKQQLGDLLVKYDARIAATVYYYAKVPAKTILCFIKSGKSDKVIQYCTNEDYKPNWANLLENVQKMNRENVAIFAKQLVDKDYLKPIQVVNVLLSGGRNDIEKATEFLLEYLNARGDKEEDAELQTKILEINLRSHPQVADAIFDECELSHYDKNYIARLCENVKLYHRALKQYDSLEDIKRCLQSGIADNMLTKDFILTFFGDLTPEDAIQCLQDLLQYQSTQLHLAIVVEICQRYNDQLTTEKLIELFEDNQCWNGLFLYLQNIVNFTQDSTVVYKYIVAASECGQFNEIREICARNEVYDAEQIKTFLLESPKIKDPRALIHVCDKHGFVEELTHYLYSNQLYQFIEVYVLKMNQAATPKVIASLLDLNAPEDQIKNILQSVRPPQCPIDELVEEVEKRERLNLLLTWLEQRLHEGLEDKQLHNALAKIYVNINNNPQHFLMTNKFYDHETVGKFCESRDPRLAFIAYKQSNGECDQLLINVAYKNGFYKDLARHLVERQDLEFWKSVLSKDENMDEKKDEIDDDDDNNKEDDHRRSLIDQVINSALPESRNPEEVSAAVKAFMNADLPNILLELLEKIVLSASSDYNFRNSENLQNLLMVTAIKAEPTKVIGYIDSLDNYDGLTVAKICKQDENKLYQEAFLIYKKFNRNVEAIDVLLYDLKDLERGREFAEYLANDTAVWSILGKAQLDNDLISESIASFIKADDAQHYQNMILSVNKFNDDKLYQELINYLKMARSKVRDKAVDSELIYSFARIKDLVNLEKFISDTHNASLSKVGDRIFDESLFEAAKIIFAHINNYSKLASCLVRLEEFKEAVDAARKANSIQTWKDVCFACIDYEKFKLAQMCGVHIIIFMDHMNDLIKFYEEKGHFAELIHLLEQGINLDRVHQGIYTQLGVLYSKYNENKLMEHINLFWTRLNVPTLLQSCKDNQHWKECVVLYKNYDSFDQAAEIIMLHSTECWTHEEFKYIMLRVSNSEIFYRAINFYLNEHPLQLSELLIELSSKLDHKRVVSIFATKRDQMALIKAYLQFVQKEDVMAVNEALNDLFVEEDDYKSLKESVETFENFDQIALAQRLQKNELLEFRRISAVLYRNQFRFKTSIALSKQDGLWQDTMDTAKLSNDTEIVEDLLRFFVESIKTETCPKSCFAACLFTCFDLIKPDVVLELSWKNDLFEYSMPFMVQAMRHWNDKFDALNDRVQVLEEKLMEKNQVNDQENIPQPFNPNMIAIGMPQIAYYNNNNMNNNGAYF